MKKTLILITLLLTACGGGLPDNYQSWYVPGYMTVNVNFGQPQAEAMADEPLSHDIIILSDIGSSIDYINKDGSTRWRKAAGDRRLSGLHRWDNTSLSYIDSSLIMILDISTGELTNLFSPLHENMGDFQRTDSGYIATTENSVVLLDANYRVTWRNPHRSQYSRSAIKVNNTVVVADTFGHRIYGVDITTNEITFETDEYYPNMVAAYNDKILIVGEHSNRVYLFNPVTHERESIYACGFYPFNDVYSTTATIRELENDPTHPLLIDPSQPKTSKSICSGDMYSPNGAACSDDGTCYFTSTDDGEVRGIDQFGDVFTTVSGLNNPANILIIN